MSPDTGAIYDIVYTDVLFGSVWLEFDRCQRLVAYRQLDDLVFAPACP